MNEKKRLLLISNSTQYGHGYLDHAEQEIRGFLATCKRVLFVPYALFDRDGYAETARARFEPWGHAVVSIHHTRDPIEAVENAEALFIGGGNTFRLLKSLYEYGLIGAIRRRVEAGMPYVGASAGSVVAAPTMRTTNDMPIVEPPSLTSLALVPFQINAHYIDPDPSSTHMGETRDVRLRQFLEENDTPVVALREGSMLRVENSTTVLKGTTGAKIFRRGETPYEVKPGAAVDPFAPGAVLDPLSAKH